MSETIAEVTAFFQRYGEISNRALADPPVEDVDGLLQCFAQNFVESSPLGTSCGHNGPEFAAAVPKGWAHYRSVGGKAMRVTDIVVESLDDLHAMARVGWAFDYVNKAGVSGTVAFTNIYFVTLAEGRPKIFGYITPDEQQAMKDHGLV